MISEENIVGLNLEDDADVFVDEEEEEEEEEEGGEQGEEGEEGEEEGSLKQVSNARVQVCTESWSHLRMCVPVHARTFNRSLNTQTLRSSQ